MLVFWAAFAQTLKLAHGSPSFLSKPTKVDRTVVTMKSRVYAIYCLLFSLVVFYAVSQKKVTRDATVSRPSVCLSVCLSVTIRYRVQIGLNSSKIISRPNSLGYMCWLAPNIGDLVQREHPQNWG